MSFWEERVKSSAWNYLMYCKQCNIACPLSQGVKVRKEIRLSVSWIFSFFLHLQRAAKSFSLQLQVTCNVWFVFDNSFKITSLKYFQSVFQFSDSKYNDRFFVGSFKLWDGIVRINNLTTSKGCYQIKAKAHNHNLSLVYQSQCLQVI